MITKDNLPSAFRPFERLEVCSNLLIGGIHLFAIGDAIPLLIGKGRKPEIWLDALVEADAQKFISVVEESVPKFPIVKVYESEGRIFVEVSGQRVLVVEEKSEDHAVVSFLDLRPVGLNVVGDHNSLSAGGNTFAFNTMQGAGVFIGFDAPKSEAQGVAETSNSAAT